MTIAQLSRRIYKRTKTNISDWSLTGSSGQDLVDAMNAMREYMFAQIRDKTDNYYPTAWTTTDLSTGTAVPEFDADFHLLLADLVIFEHWQINEPQRANDMRADEIAPKLEQFKLFYAIRNYRIFTITIAAPGIITRKNHGVVLNDRVIFSTSGALPTGLSANTWYYVVSDNITDDTFCVSATKAGTAITTTGSQSGTHWFASDRILRMSTSNRGNDSNK